MNIFRNWWQNDLPVGVKIVLITLLANGLPAFIILLFFPNFTEFLFVWTIKPVINARLIMAMYSNAMLLVIFSAFQTKWEKVRVNMVVITLFSILATLLTFVYLKPFLAHPWYHLAYWLTMYLILFFAAPYVFVTQEKKSGGKLPVRTTLNTFTRVVTGISVLVSLLIGLGLLFNIDLVNQYWPWKLPPLVGGLIGVLFTTHAAAYTWALWDGDWHRVKPIFWQGPITATIFLLLPIVHPGDLHPDPGFTLTLYNLINGFFLLAFSFIILRYRNAKEVRSDE